MILKKTRRFTQLLQNKGNSVRFDDLAQALLSGIEDTSVYVISRTGKVLGYALAEGFESTEFSADWLEERRVPEDINDSVLKIGALASGNEAANVLNGENAIIAPIVGTGRRVGTLLFVREDGEFSEDEPIIADFAATCIGMIISHAINEEEEDEAIEREMARSAITSLSYSEILAMQHIFDELDGYEGLLVASRVADEAGITRSVIVNALRKLASANVIESRSLGMKGTYLRILNKEIKNELERQRYPFPDDNPALKKQA